MSAKITTTSDVVGWPAARRVLDGVAHEGRRDLLVNLTLRAGVHGAPAMEHVARLLRWRADERPAPVRPARLAASEAAHCERCVDGLIGPFLTAGDWRMPRASYRTRRAA